MYNKTWRAVLTVLVFGFLIVAMIALKAVFFSVPASADIVLKPVIYPDVGEVIELIDKWDEFRMTSYINALPKDWLCDARITGVTQCG